MTRFPSRLPAAMPWACVVRMLPGLPAGPGIKGSPGSRTCGALGSFRNALELVISFVRH